MAGIVGKVGLDGEKEFRKALRDINAELRQLSAEGKKTEAVYKSQSDSLEALNAKQKILQDTQSAQISKVEKLKSILAEASEQYGENSASAQKWKLELTKAETALAGTENSLADLDKALDEATDSTEDTAKGLDDLGESAEKANSKTGKLKSILSDIGKGIGAAAGAAITAAAGAVASLTKSAIESYSQYEQLAGGVDTLFGDEAAQKVKSFANNAFSSAGMSANEYMETVTSFSASLISSLGNDTDKAADYANTAIIDMSDNANKMGTDISSIQTAYAGFAKQNYTMLDNLKLGYGGTAEEMLRLVNDSGVLGDTVAESMKDVSFDQIIQAIHVVQENLGIANATADESATTIEGSLNSLKAAWTNALTGIADDSQDFGVLIDNLVLSISNAAKNIIPRVQIAIGGIMELVGGLASELPGIIDELLPTVLDGIVNLSNEILAILPGLLSQVLGYAIELIPQILTLLPTILDTLLLLLIEVTNSITENLDMILSAIMEILPLLVNSLVEATPILLEAAIIFLLAIVNALPIITEKLLIDELPHLIGSLTESLVSASPQLLTAAVELLTSIIAAIPVIVVQIVANTPLIIEALKNGLIAGWSQIKGVGSDLIGGLWNGISDKIGWIKEKIKGFSSAIISSIKSIFGIKSPSRVMRDEIGKNLGLGLIEGFEDSLGNASARLARSVNVSLVSPAVAMSRGANITVNNTFGGSYAERDGAKIVRSINRRLGLTYGVR